VRTGTRAEAADRAFIQATIETRDTLARLGCPVGTLCAELHKANGPLAQRAAKLFDDSLRGADTQFRLPGKGAEARDLAVQLIAALQGGSLLAHAFHSPRLVTRESTRLKEWVRSL
jgi:TetR/AcrR family transcriptional repressor of nem operon